MVLHLQYRAFKGPVNSRFTIAELNHLYSVSLLYTFEKKGEIRDICLVFQQIGNSSEQAIKEILRPISRTRTLNLSLAVSSFVRDLFLSPIQLKNIHFPFILLNSISNSKFISLTVS